MIPFLQRFAISCIFAIWGGVILTLWQTGRLASYLHPSFQPFTVVSGFLFILIAFLLLASRKNHLTVTLGSGSKTWKRISLILLTVPVLAAAFLSEDQFSATAIRNRKMLDTLPMTAHPSPPINEEQTATRYLKKNATGVVQVSIIDLLYAATEIEMQRDFDEKSVEVMGQFLPDPNHKTGENQFQLTRVFITCCAADAQSLSLTVKTATPPSFPEMSWVKVVGKVTFTQQNGKPTPVILADSTEITNTPEEKVIFANGD